MLIACSGGPDSVALLGLLCRLQRSEALVLAVGHVDHGLRPESRAEADHVARLARDAGVEFRHVRLELAPGTGLPARARVARRAALEAMAEAWAAPSIALGHTATDQAETMLLHLARGAGLEGLAAMADLEPRRGGHWLRPLLGLTRQHTRDLAVRMGLAFVDDPTNEIRRHPRVAVRHDVLPVLRRFRPHTDEAFAAAADKVREAHEALAWMVTRELVARRRPHHWDVQAWPAMPRALRTAWLRSVCAEAGVDPSALASRTVDAIDRSLCARSGARRGWDLRPRKRLWIESERLWFTKSDGDPEDGAAPGTRSEGSSSNH